MLNRLFTGNYYIFALLLFFSHLFHSLLMSESRKSLLPQPGYTQSCNYVPETTPTHSPTKLRSVSNSSTISPISPSKIPIYVDVKKFDDDDSDIQEKKRTLPGNIDDYLNLLESHLSDDIDSERSVLSKLNKDIENKRLHHFKLNDQIRHLRLKEKKIADDILEFQYGIIAKNRELKNAQNQIRIDNDKVSIEKKKIDEEFKKRELDIINEMELLLDDAKISDPQTIKLQNDQINSLKLKKEKLLSEIEVAKQDMDLKLKNFENSLLTEKIEKESQLSTESSALKEKSNSLRIKYNNLKEEFNDLQNQDNQENAKIKQLKLDIENKHNEIDKLKFRALDLKNLINDLKLDLKNTSTLCDDFENDEYKSAKINYELALSRLNNERYKRLKIEIQIKHISGIPNILILDNGNISSFENTNLYEFVKPLDYNWKPEIFTTLETSMDGISFCLVTCSNHESKAVTLDFYKELQEHLKALTVKQDRFKTYTKIEISYLDVYENIELLIPKDFLLMESAKAIHVNLSTEFASKNALIFLYHCKTPQELEDLSRMMSKLQFVLLAENISDDWASNLQHILTIKPVHSRESYSFLNSK